MSNLYPDESISVDKCWERLHANTLGRLILTDGQHVDVLPVLYAVASQDDKQEIYIRTTRGNKFSSVVTKPSKTASAPSSWSVSPTGYRRK